RLALGVEGGPQLFDLEPDGRRHRPLGVEGALHFGRRGRRPLLRVQLRLEGGSRRGRLGLGGSDTGKVQNETLQRAALIGTRDGRFQRGQALVELRAKRVELALRGGREVLPNGVRRRIAAWWSDLLFAHFCEAEPIIVLVSGCTRQVVGS